MGLKEAVLEIAQQIEDDIPFMEGEYGGNAGRELLGYARALRTACKSAPDDKPANADLAALAVAACGTGILLPGRSEEQDKANMLRRRTIAEEHAGVSQVRCEGGPADGDMVPLADAAPEGCNVMQDGEVYRLEFREHVDPHGGRQRVRVLAHRPR